MVMPDGFELMINEVDLGKVIGITKTLAQKLSDTEELRKLLITGFPYAPFESVLKRLGWTRAQVGEALGFRKEHWHAGSKKENFNRWSRTESSVSYRWWPTQLKQLAMTKKPAAG